MQEKPIQLLTMALSLECSHCGLPVPLNGPTQLATCPNCQKRTAPTRLVPVMLAAKGTGQVFNSNVRCLRSHRNGPACATCGRVFEVWRLAQHRLEAAQGLACPGCGSELSAAPAPAWLRAELPSVLAIFGAEREGHTGASAVSLALEQAALQPIAMACPQCAGGLSIAATDARTITCRYCSSAVFIPDALWHRLHPVKLASDWSISFRERLLSAEALRERASQVHADAKRQAQQDEQQARRRAQAVWEQEQQALDARDEEARIARRQKTLLLVMAGVGVLTLGIAVWLGYVR